MKYLVSFLVAVILAPNLAWAAPIKGYCVLWLRTDRNINIRGNAWDIMPNIRQVNMDVGDVLLTTEGRGHAAEAIGFKGEVVRGSVITPATITVIENWQGRIRVRDIAWDDARIRGVYRQNDYPQPF